MCLGTCMQHFLAQPIKVLYPVTTSDYHKNAVQLKLKTN